MNAKPFLVCLVLWCCGSLSQAQSDSRRKTAAEQLNQQWSRGQAEGRGPVKLATFPLRVEDISHINPMGMMASVTYSDSRDGFRICLGRPVP